MRWQWGVHASVAAATRAAAAGHRSLLQLGDRGMASTKEPGATRQLLLLLLACRH